VSCPYIAAAGRGLRYDDPALAISWPLRVTRISDRDKSWPLLDGQGPTEFAATAGSGA
jgi:dTDP-4-dehydrorhamnose 3,5-epimerase